LGRPKISIIVPTLNEERYIAGLLRSINAQLESIDEVIVVDGGSMDRTIEIARSLGARVIVYRGLGEFASRNLGVEESTGGILVFTCADVIFSPSLLREIAERFQRDSALIALSGPGIPYNAPLSGHLLYGFYNTFRLLFGKLPRPLQRFSTSTNFLAVRRSAFVEAGTFRPEDVNADGLMGAKLLRMGKVEFSPKTYVYISVRRLRSMGLASFILHYLYVLENFFPLSNSGLIRKRKVVSRLVHGKLHTARVPK
jgi:glycosyltransferase involved in cell wall biosynthesis